MSENNLSDKKDIKEVFSKIPNVLFFDNEGNNKNKIDLNNSLLNKVKDDKLILIIHYLYTLTNYYNVAPITINYLLSKCNYCNNTNSVNDFKNILKYLRDLKLINYIDKNYKAMDVIEIDTSNLFTIDRFTLLTQIELNTLILKSENKKELLNLLKTYLYLKCRCWKRGNNDYDISIVGGRSQTTFVSYKNISDYTNISESVIIKYIEKLRSLKLIDYKNLGKKYNNEDKNKILSECNNIYTINNIVDNVDIELKEGLKQQKKYYEDNGYTITKKDYKNNDRAVNGRKGYLIKKQNNNTITDVELQELNIINTDIELYKIQYKARKKKK